MKQIGQEDPSHQNLGILRRIAAEARVKIPQVLQDLVRDGYVPEIEYDASEWGESIAFYSADYKSHISMILAKPREYLLGLRGYSNTLYGSAATVAKMFRAYVDGDEAAMNRLVTKLRTQP